VRFERGRAEQRSRQTGARARPHSLNPALVSLSNLTPPSLSPSSLPPRSVYAIGTSGGACAASYLFFGNDGDGDAANDTADVDRTVAYISECAVYARSHWRHPFRILACLEGAMDRFQPGGGCDGSGAGPAPSSSSSPLPAPPSAAAGLGPAAAAALAGNLEVSVTTLPFLRNVRVRDFGGPAGLRAAMLASACAIPVTPVWVPSLGAWCVDGAVSDIRLLKGMLLGRRFTSLHQVEGAVSVSPFYAARADITPSAFVPPWWGAYPPAPADLRWLFELGRRDALAWLDGRGRLPAGAVAAASGDDADHPPGPDAPTWRALLWEVRHLEAARAARAARLGRAVRGRGPTPSSPSPATRRLPALARRLAWALIAGELFLSLLACALAVLVGPVLRDGVPTAAAARRWSAAVRGVAGLAVGALAGRRAGAGQAGPPVDATLREHSAVWRWLRFCL